MNKLKQLKYRTVLPLAMKIMRLLMGRRSEGSHPAFFFIIGSGRNGSTLLSTILNNNPLVFIPPEQYVIPFSSAKWQLNRHRSGASILTDMREELLRKRKTVNWILERDDYQVVEEEQAWNSFVEFCYAVFRRYAQKIGKTEARVFGEKSPMTTHYLQLIAGEFTAAKYIFLIRDPRDVIFSFSKVPDHKANDLEYAIWKWKDAVEQYQWIIKRSPSTILVSYENMVREPRQTLMDVHEFLGLAFKEDLLEGKNDSSLMGVSTLVHHQNLTKPVSTDSIGKWRGEMEEAHLQLIQKKLGRLAAAFGYDLFD